MHCCHVSSIALSNSHMYSHRGIPRIRNAFISSSSSSSSTRLGNHAHGSHVHGSFGIYFESAGVSTFTQEGAGWGKGGGGGAIEVPRENFRQPLRNSVPENRGEN